MNTTKTTTVGGQTIPLDPPTPPRKPHKLLWIDTETTGISRTNAKLLEIGMIVTSMDGIEEHDRFICPVRPDKLSLYEWMQNEATEYELHPAGTNVDYDIDLLTNQLGPHLHPDWLRQLTNHRKLDLSTYRLSDMALGHNPYQDHTGNHRVEDCIRRDRNDYANYLDIMRAGIQGARS